MAQYSVLQRIELLLGVNNVKSSLTDNERLETIYTKLTEYISTTKSMLHECMLTLAETVVEQLAEKEPENEYDEDLYDCDSLSENYYSDPEEGRYCSR